jgi:hypothetical protein
MSAFAKHAVPLLPFFFLQCQNLGTLEDIYVGYIDSDGDEVILLTYIFIILTLYMLYNGYLSVRYLSYQIRFNMTEMLASLSCNVACMFHII